MRYLIVSIPYLAPLLTLFATIYVLAVLLDSEIYASLAIGFSNMYTCMLALLLVSLIYASLAIGF